MGWAEQDFMFTSLSSHEPTLRSADISLHPDSMMLLSPQSPLHFHILWLSHAFPILFCSSYILNKSLIYLLSFFFFLKFICESTCNVDVALIPGLGRSPGEGKGNPLQYSCLGNSMDRGVWWAIMGLQELDTT